MVGNPPKASSWAGVQPTLHGVWTQDLFWVPGSQNGLYQWTITPRQRSLFWVYMCMTEILGHRRSYPLHPFAPIHQFSAWHMCLQWNYRRGGLPNPLLYDSENSLPQQHLLTPPRKWKKGDGKMQKKWRHFECFN